MSVAALFAAATAAAADTPDAAPKKPAWNVNQPPGEARTVNLDTRTGTWMSVDVSPEQALDRVRPAGRPVPAFAGQRGRRGQAADPLDRLGAPGRFSPDGKQIAYISDAGGGDNVWVMNVDGSNARAVSNEDYRLLNNPV
ncbi:MAG: hypothetical protein U1F53_03225 [Burkholderiaceae bacterium]